MSNWSAIWLLPLFFNITLIIFFVIKGFQKNYFVLIKCILLNYLGANCLLIIIFYSLWQKQYFLIDIAMLYAIVGFVANLAISDYFVNK